MRESGILMPIAGLSSKYGIGCFSKEAYEFADKLAAAGQKYWQILPLGPTGYGNSPYQSFSTFAGNPYYIDLEKLIEEGFLLKEECTRCDFGMEETKIDYEKLYNYRYSLLRKAYDRWNLTEDNKFVLFCQENDSWLYNYTLYMAIKDSTNGASWDMWEDKLRMRDVETLMSIAEELEYDMDFYAFLQYKFKEQWSKLKKYINDKGIKIIGDIPIYVAFDSSDVWANPELFLLDKDRMPIEVAGCPPDAFTALGQLWGNPLYEWGYHKQTGYKWWIERMRWCCETYDVVRIDHFRGFDEFYCVPFGHETAEHGLWRKGPAIELFRSIENELGILAVIAEDLGYITDSVRELLKETAYPGMKVLQFAFGSGENNIYLPHNYNDSNCVVYTGTHDNDTLNGWYKAMSDLERHNINMYLNNYYTPDDEVNWDFILLAQRSIADLCIVPLQDYLGLGNEARLNFPSTLGGNWEWRMKKDAFNEELADKIYKITKSVARCK